MTEFGFIVALEIGGFVLALTLSRVASTREPGASVYRVVSAVVRALQSFLARERGAIAAAGLLGLVLAIGTFALFGHVERGLVVAAGLTVGAPLCSVGAALAAACTARAAGATHASARLGFNAALAAALRAGGAVGLGTETASTLGALAVFGVTYLAEGGGGASASAVSLTNPCLAVVGYAFGAALAALVVERAGSTYRVGAEAGRSRAVFDATSDLHDPRNPALVAGLVADHVGSVASGSATFFALSATATAATLWCAQGIGASTNEQLHAAALPLVCRCFGMVGCAAGTLVARADEAQGQGFALTRGLASASAITLFGILGGSYWLAPDAWWFFAVAGTFGLVAAAAPSAVLFSLTDRRARPLRDAVEALRSGVSAAFGASIGHALPRAVAPIVALVALAIVASALGERANASSGAVSGSAVFTLSLLALAPFALTLLAMSAVARSARGTAALSKLDMESAFRLQRLDDVGFRAAAAARALLLTASVLCVLPALMQALLSSGSLGLGRPGALLAGTLGALAVLAHGGRSARAASRTADEVTLEVRRQLGGAEAGEPGGGVPEGYTPSYRACEELTQSAASAGLVAEAARAVAPSVLLGIGLGLVYRVGGSRLAAAAVSTFVATAAVTALGAALAVDGARTVHSGARRSARLERETASSAAPISEDVLANILGIAAGPSACSQALLLASFALAVLELVN